MKRNWIQRAFNTMFSSYPRGVSILLHKCLRCVVEQVFSYPEARYVAVILAIDTHKLAVINLVPPHFIKRYSLHDF